MELYATILSIRAMRKSLETDVGITAPRYMRVGHYDLSCFLCFEVSHASYTQDESITPRYFSEMSRTEFPQSDCKITQSIMSFQTLCTNPDIGGGSVLIG